MLLFLCVFVYNSENLTKFYGNHVCQALRIKRLWLDDDNVSIYTTLNNLGHTHYKNKDLDQALKSYTESLYLQTKRLSSCQYNQLMGPDLLSTTCEVIAETYIIQ